MSLLTILQNAATDAGISRPTRVIDSTNADVIKLKRTLVSVGERLMLDYLWPELTRAMSITLVADRASYPLPADFARHVPNTQWNDDQAWPLYGPVDPETWRAYQHGVVSSLPRSEFRPYGYESMTTYAEGMNQFYIFPTPAAGDAGEVLYGEYITKEWILPAEWTPGEAVETGEYRSIAHRIYTADAAGTCGTTLPTHTTGSASDGGVTWSYWNVDANGRTRVYDTFLADEDRTLFNEEVLALGTAAYYREDKGLPAEALRDRFEKLVRKRSSALSGVAVASMRGRGLRRRGWNIPNDNYGP